MNKIHVLDTSVLINDSNAPKKFNKVYIPIEVVEELDKLKTNSGKLGQQARLAIKFLDNWKDTKNCKIYFDIKKYPNNLQDIPDNRILASARNLQKRRKNQKVVIVSCDFNLRLKAKISGLEAEDYFEKSSSIDIYSGVEEIEDHDLYDKLFIKEFVDCPIYLKDIYPNQCLIVKGINKTLLARKIANQLKLIKPGQKIWGIEAKNKEQAMAIDLLMDDKLSLITLIGKSGCGKTLISLAFALESIFEKHKYDRLVIYKPMESVGKDIGFMPGDCREKLMPWMGSILDNLQSLFGQYGERFQSILEMYERKGKIEFGAISHIRGRSIDNSIMLIDEAQQLDHDEIKAILTRAGKNTKIVLTGDIEQIDRSDINFSSCGLTSAVERFKMSELAGHLTLVKGERSALATLASQIL